MTYKINELFYSIQGEGNWTGRPAVFCRFSGCNLWSGHEDDRAGAICKFCDTDFAGSTEYDGDTLTKAVDSLSPADDHKMVVFTGGEPAQQLQNSLLADLQGLGFYTAIETNGTLTIDRRTKYLDWVCVSPKTRRLNVREGNELKLVYPQQDITPEMFNTLGFEHFWLSPMDGPDLQRNTRMAYEYCLEHPQWRLNIQTHKVIGVR